MRVEEASIARSSSTPGLTFPSKFFFLSLYPKWGQEVRLFVTSTCDPQPSMLRSPRGGQGGISQAWAVTSG